MQANHGGLEPNGAGAHAQYTLEAGPLPPQHVDAGVHELNETRLNALRLIDEGSFSYVALPPPGSLVCSLRAVCSWFHFKVCLVAGTGFFTDA
jgi:hypothetical protein